MTKPRPLAVAPSSPKKAESGFRTAVGRLSDPKGSFFEDFGEETTAVERVSAHLVAATAARDDELDDEPPTCAMPVDLAAMLTIISASGLSSPIGDTPLPPQAPHAPQPPGFEMYRSPPSIIWQDSRQPEVPRGETSWLVLVALLAFGLTLATATAAAWALGPWLPALK